ncbi:MAG: type II toxin-antitoxin system VapB family antitoxin [Parvibaculaceae bacterium]
MSMFIRDETVNALANRLQRRMKAPSKTVAVRTALQNELQRLEQGVPLRERVRKYQDAIASCGSVDVKFDEKAFMDEMWGA